MLPGYQAPRPRAFQLAGVIGTYWTVSISMVFLNKHILSGIFTGLDMSFFVSWYQCVAAILLIVVTGNMAHYFKLPLKLPPLSLRTLLHPDMLKLSFSFVASLTLNNLMLKHIEVAFYQVARSFTLIFTIILSWYMLNKAIRLSAIFPCLFIITGFFIGINQEDISGTLSFWGIIYGLLASFSVAVCGIYFKKAEAVVEGDSFKLAYFNNVNAAVIFLPLVLSSNQIQIIANSDLARSLSMWLLLTISGVLSLTIGWVSAMQIKYTSPLTHHISINAKSVTMTVAAVTLHHSDKSFLWWCGSMMVIVGVMWYAYIKMNEDPAGSDKVITVNNVSSVDRPHEKSKDDWKV